MYGDICKSLKTDFSIKKYMANVRDVVQEIHEVDREIIKLLRIRVQLTKDFYGIEAQSKTFHKDAEKKIKEHMSLIAKEARVDEKIVRKLYKQVHKHAKSHNRSIKSSIRQALRRNK